MGALASPRPGLFERAKARLGFSAVVDKRYDAQPSLKHPLTLTVSTKAAQKWQNFGQVKKDLERRNELWNMSIQNGPAAVILDAYEHSIWTNGWTIESDDPGLAERITQRMQRMHAELELRKMTTDGFRFGYGIAEKAKTQDVFNPKLALVTRCARQFDLISNTPGFLVAVRQYDAQGRPITELPIERAMVLMPLITSEGFGKSLLEQCYAPLQWWNMVNQASADAIWRHGYPVFDVQVGGPDGSLAPLDVMTGAEAVTTDLNPNSELIGNALTQIKELNQAGVPLVDKYGEWVLQQICASSKVPEELFGLGKGNTGLLAASKWAIFYDGIASIQHTLEPQVDDQLIDPLAQEEGGAPGDAHFTFSNPNPENSNLKADYCKKLLDLGMSAGQPIVDAAWVRDQLGIKQPEMAPNLNDPLGSNYDPLARYARTSKSLAFAAPDPVTEVQYTGDDDRDAVLFASAAMPKAYARTHLFDIAQAIRKLSFLKEYENFTPAETRAIQDIIAQAMLDPDGWTVSDLIRRIKEIIPDADTEALRRIVRTESGRIAVTAREVEAKDNAPESARYIWAGPKDWRTCAVHEDILRRQPKDGLPLDKLKDFIADVAREHGVTVTDGWTIHPNQRGVFVRSHGGL